MFNKTKTLFVSIIAVVITSGAAAQSSSVPAICSLGFFNAGLEPAVVNVGKPIAVLQADAPEFLRQGKLQKVSLSLKFLEPLAEIQVTGYSVNTGASDPRNAMFSFLPWGGGKYQGISAGQILFLTEFQILEEPLGAQISYNVCIASPNDGRVQHLSTKFFVGRAMSVVDRDELKVDSASVYPTNSGQAFLLVEGSFPLGTIMCTVVDQISQTLGNRANILCPVPDGVIGPTTVDITVTMLESGKSRTFPGVIIP